MAIRETRMSRQARLSRRYGFRGYRQQAEGPGAIVQEANEPPSTSGGDVPEDAPQQAADLAGASDNPANVLPEGEATGLDPALAQALALAGAAGSGAPTPSDEFEMLFGGYADPASQVFTGTTREGAGRNLRDADEALRSVAAELHRNFAEVDDQEIQDSVTEMISNIGRLSNRLRTEGESRGAEPETAAASTLYQSIYDMSPSDLSRIQRVLFAGGFYGGADIDNIGFGTPDEITFEAWSAAVTRAARKFRGGEGEQVTVEDVMREAALASRVDVDENGQVIGGTGADADAQLERTYEINLTDPESIRFRARDIAHSVVQRDPTQEEQRLIVAAINSMERETQIQTQDQAYSIEEAALLASSRHTPGGGIPVYVDSRGRVIGLAGGEDDTPASRTPSANMGENYQQAERRIDVLFPGDPGYDEVAARAGVGTGAGGRVNEITNRSVDVAAQVDAWFRNNRPVDVNEATGISTLMDVSEFMRGGGR